MKVTLRASTGVSILLWREDHSFLARRPGEASEPQVCLAVDLFEVIAELTGLDLEQGVHAAEAIKLADAARRRLHAPTQDHEQSDDESSAEAGGGSG